MNNPKKFFIECKKVFFNDSFTLKNAIFFFIKNIRPIVYKIGLFIQSNISKLNKKMILIYSLLFLILWYFLLYYPLLFLVLLVEQNYGNIIIIIIIPFAIYVWFRFFWIIFLEDKEELKTPKTIQVKRKEWFKRFNFCYIYWMWILTIFNAAELINIYYGFIYLYFSYLFIYGSFFTWLKIKHLIILIYSKYKTRYWRIKSVSQVPQTEENVEDRMNIKSGFLHFFSGDIYFFTLLVLNVSLCFYILFLIIQPNPNEWLYFLYFFSIIWAYLMYPLVLTAFFALVWPILYIIWIIILFIRFLFLYKKYHWKKFKLVCYLLILHMLLVIGWLFASFHAMFW